MAMSLSRTGGAVVVGAASAVLAPPTVAPLTFGTTVITWSTVAEALALIGGGAMQMLAPFTMPNIADGLVDGGAALLSRRGVLYALALTRPAALMGVQVGGQAMDAGAYARPSYNGRGQVGANAGLPKKTLS